MAGENTLHSEPEVFEFTFSGVDGIKTVKNILKSAEPAIRTSSSISRIFSSTYYVFENDRVDEIVDSFNEHASLLSIGVVDGECRPVGVIVRRELFNILGRSFGKDLVEMQTASKVMREFTTFQESASLFAVSNAVQREIAEQEIRYFVAVSVSGKFSGVFSTRDLLIHLANMSSKDVETARRIQSRIVEQDRVYTNDSFHLVCHSSMALGVGGDFYMLQHYAGGRYHLSIADVSGKGISASLITAMACGMATSYDFTKGLNGFVRDINDYVLRTFESEKFITGIFMDIHTGKNRISVCDMGHSFILYIRNGKFCSFRGHETNYPLGIAPLTDIATGSIPVQKGDILFISTDGIAEQIDVEGEQYGEERLKETLLSVKNGTPEQIGDAVKKSVNTFRGSQPQKDDLTFLVLKWTG